MFIESNRLNQLNKNIFGHGILQMKKLTPDSGRMVMPDPSLPKIKRYNIKSNNPLNYLLNASAQPQQPRQVPTQQEIQLPPESQENILQPQEDLYSQKSPQQNQEIKEEEKIQEPETQPEPEPVVAEPTTKKFVVTNLGENNILLPPNYSTDDELEFKVINLLNEPKENFKFACENEYAKVYKRKVSFIFLLLLIFYREKMIFNY